ncbi:hypothetical protein LTR33_017158, partial [Friedmanniomyces endolithicus]
MATSTPNAADLLLQPWDILILGSGSAALCAALSATESASPPPRILLVDKAPLEWAGGNGYFTAGAYRTQHDGLEDLLPVVSNVSEEMVGKIDLPAYSREDFAGDLERVTEGRSSKVLGRYVVGESLETVRWLKGWVVDWWLRFRRQAYFGEG